MKGRGTPRQPAYSPIVKFITQKNEQNKKHIYTLNKT